MQQSERVQLCPLKGAPWRYQEARTDPPQGAQHPPAITAQSEAQQALPLERLHSNQAQLHLGRLRVQASHN